MVTVSGYIYEAILAIAISDFVHVHEIVRCDMISQFAICLGINEDYKPL